MKKLFLAIVIAALSILSAQAQTVTRTAAGNYVATRTQTTRTATQPRDTGKTYTDTDGKTYKIYMGKTGSCFIVRTSRNGNEYKKYLGPEISAQICKELGVQYTPRTRN